MLILLFLKKTGFLKDRKLQANSSLKFSLVNPIVFKSPILKRDFRYPESSYTIKALGFRVDLIENNLN